MATYFDTVSKSFADVKIDEKGVNTVEFLEASEGVVKMFDLLGGAAFSVVQSDLTGNIKKVREYHDAHPAESTTLEELVISEKDQKKRTATEGLMWLLRGLHFTLVGLQRSHADKNEELSVSFNKSYESTLKQHHSFVVRPVFALAMKACPYRADFYKKLGTDQAQVDVELKKWLDALDVIVKRMQGFYEAGKHSKGL